MRKKIRNLMLSLALVGALSCSKSEGDLEKTVKTTQAEKVDQRTCEEKLRGASEIRIEEAWASLGKHYNIFVGKEKVGEITGKSFTLWADEFKLKTVDGKVLASEKEEKKLFQMSRGASCYNSSGNLVGYIGEEALKDLFSWSHVFHVYDSKKREVGKSKKLGDGSFGLHDLYDDKGNVDYSVRSKGILRDVYAIEVKDRDSSIPLEHAMFVVCIEDAICDAKEAESSSDDD